MEVLNREIQVTDTPALPGGLLNIVPVQDIGAAVGRGIVWESQLCATPAAAPGVCDDALATADAEKAFGAPAYGEADPFGIYIGLECSPAFKDYERRATEALKFGEGHAVERGVDSLILSGATVLNGGVAVSMTNAIAVLEAAIRDLSSGGLIHVSAFGAAYLASKRGVDSDKDFILHTAQGTPIVNGGGYSRTGPAGAAVTNIDEGFWMYATGHMEILRGSVEYSQGLDVSTNTERGLAEKLFAVSNQCFTVAIQVDPSL